MTLKNILQMVSLVLTVVLLQGQVTAQQALTDADRSVVAFEIQVEKLVAEAKSQGLEPDEFLQNAKLGGPLPLKSISWADIVKVDGGFSLPQDIAAMTPEAEMKMVEGDAPPKLPPAKPVPFEGVIRIQLATAEAGQRLAKDLETQAKVETAADGSIHYRSHDEYAPPNILIRKVSDTEFELLTDKFAASQQRDFKTAELAERWSAMPDKPLRIAVEMTTNAKLVGQVAEMIKQENPPMSNMVDAVVKMKSLALAVGLEDEELLDLLAVANTAEDAKEFKSVLNGLLFLARSQGKAMLAGMDQNSPMVKTANEVLSSLKAKQSEENVTLKIAAPAEFAAAVGAAVVKVREAAQRVQRSNNLRQAMLAAYTYESVHNQFPFNLPEEDYHPDLSWRVAISSFAEGPADFDYTKGPKDPANAKFAQQMPEFFGSDNEATMSWVKSDIREIGEIKDGTSNTICFIENPKGKTPWMERNDISQEDAFKLIKALPAGERISVAFYDGSVQTIGSNVDDETLKNLLNPSDSNIVNFP